MVSDVSGATHRQHPFGLLELVSCDYCEILTQHQTVCGYYSRLQEIRDFNFSPKTQWTVKCLLLFLQTCFELLPYIWPWCLTPSAFTNVSTPLTLILLKWRKWWTPNNASKWQMGFNSAFKGLNDSILSSGRCQWTRGLSCGSAVVFVLRFLVQIPPDACLPLFVSFVSCQVEVSAASWSPVHRGPNNCCAWSRNLMNEETMTCVWPQGHRNKMVVVILKCRKNETRMNK